MLTSRKGPDFLIIGAQKAGTTALFHHLSRHPEIRTPKKKEVNFFHKNSNYDKGVVFYHSFFSKRSVFSKKLSFEATPAYLYYYEEVPKRVFDYDPTIKLIVTLRDPVERALSAMNMFYQLKEKNRDSVLKRMAASNHFDIEPAKELYLSGKTPDLKGLIEYEKELMGRSPSPREPSFIRRGFYKEQIEGWFKYFPPEQFFFLDQEELKNEPKKVLFELFSFLGLKFSYCEDLDKKEVHKREYEFQVSSNVQDELGGIYEERNNGLEKLLGKKPSWLLKHAK
jgi:hypothetical protein